MNGNGLKVRENTDETLKPPRNQQSKTPRDTNNPITQSVEEVLGRTTNDSSKIVKNTNNTSTGSVERIHSADSGSTKLTLKVWRRISPSPQFRSQPNLAQVILFYFSRV